MVFVDADPNSNNSAVGVCFTISYQSRPLSPPQPPSDQADYQFQQPIQYRILRRTVNAAHLDLQHIDCDSMHGNLVIVPREPAKTGSHKNHKHDRFVQEFKFINF